MQAALPRLTIIVACTAYLRGSRTLQRISPTWSVAVVGIGVLELFALGTVHMLLVKAIDLGLQHLLSFGNILLTFDGWVGGNGDSL